MMQMPVTLDRTSLHPLATQLADQVREAIRDGRVPAGARLPSSRELAEQLYVGRNTVVRAYETLTMEGYVETRAASGVFAARDLPGKRAQRDFARADSASVPGAEATMRLPANIPALQLPRISRHRIPFDFLPGRPNVKLFPVKTWRRMLQACMSYGGAAGLSEYGDPCGLYTLRSAIATHLSMSRGVVADPAQILIVTGIQEGLNVAARMFLSKGATVVIEDPCYRSAALVFEDAGANMIGVPVDEDGIVAAQLPEEPAALLYVTPAHQYPTGVALSSARREELIAWARRNGCYIVEDDYDSEFQYDGSPLQAMAGIAPDCTIYMGTFSTTLGAGLRLGYIVVPPALVESASATKALLNNGNAWLDQAALAEFVRGGGYGAHITRCRAQYKESRDALLTALRRHFGNVEVGGEAAGLHVCWQLPAGVPEAARLEQLARRNRVGIYSLASAGAYGINSSTLMRRSLLLGYAGMSPAQIEQGMLRLSDAVDDTLDDFPDFVGELLLDNPPQRRARTAGPSRKAGRLAPQFSQQPALRTVASRRAHSRNDKPGEDAIPMRIVRAIYRYPIKGLSPQLVRGIQLEAGKPFPFDRVFALSRPGVPVDAQAPRWAKKGLFVMLMLDDALARVQTHLDIESMQLTVLRGRSAAGEGGTGECVLTVDLGTGEGREALEAYIQDLVPALRARPRLLHAPAGHFMDKPDSVMSCINLATVRELERQWGHSINPLRFRANFYIEGMSPWEEFDWVGSDIRLGDVLFRVDRRNGRCGATNVNPVTGERDLDIPGSLRKTFGHKDLGVYLVARTAGRVVIGDHVVVPEQAGAAPGVLPFAQPAAESRSYICRGCYYIYEESRGAAPYPAGTAFADIGADWRCPDCGTDKSTFRAYHQELAEAKRA
jgi:GntR family transcriptional regulator/MocR family aminotransferase